MTARLQLVSEDATDSNMDPAFQHFLDERAQAVETLKQSRGAEGREAFLALYETHKEAIGRQLMAAARERMAGNPSTLPSPDQLKVFAVCYPHRAEDVPHGWLFPDYYKVPQDSHFVL